MPPEERGKRMQKLRTQVAEHNIYRWAGKLRSALLNFEFPESAQADLEAEPVLLAGSKSGFR